MFRLFIVLLSAFLLSACTTSRTELVMETPDGYSNPVPISSLVAGETQTWEEKAEAIEKIAEQEAASEQKIVAAPLIVEKTKRQARLVKKMKRTSKQVARLAKKKRSHSHLALK